VQTILKAKVRPKAIEHRFKRVSPEKLRKALTASNLHSMAYFMGRIHFFHDETALANLRKQVEQIILHRAGREGWQIYRKNCAMRVSAFAELLIIDVLFIYLSNEYTDRQKHLSGRDIAKLMGMDEGTWRRVWRPRFRFIRIQLQESFADMIEHVSTRTVDKKKSQLLTVN